MKIRILSIVMLFFLTLAFGYNFVFAESKDNAIKTMAEIMLHLNHYPSGTEKEALKKIVKSDSTSKHEAVLANAIINLQHKVTASDKKKLKEIINDKSISTAMHDLANIIINLNHRPNGKDIKKLQQLIK